MSTHYSLSTFFPAIAISRYISVVGKTTLGIMELILIIHLSN